VIAVTSRFPYLRGACLLSLALFAISTVQALGVGRPVILSSLGQPLHLVFALSLNADETLNPECVHAEVLAGEARVPVNLVQAQLDADSSTVVRAVRVLTAVAIDEPIVTVALNLGCPPRFTRQYTAFLDPSGQQPAADAGSGDAVLRSYTPAMQAALSTADARPAALLAAAGKAAPGGHLASVHVPTPRGTPVSVMPDVPTKPKAAISATATAVEGVRRAGPSKLAPLSIPTAASALPRPRLQLEAPETMSPAPSVGEPSLDRLQRLEQRLTQMQIEQAAAQGELKSLRLQLDQARNERFNHPLLIALVLGLLAFAGSTVYFWQSRRSERAASDSAWWNEVRSETKTRLMGESYSAAPVVSDLPVTPSKRPANTVPHASSSAFAYEEKTLDWAAMDLEDPGGFASRPAPPPRLQAGGVEPTIASLGQPQLASVPDHEPLSIQLVREHEDSRVAGTQSASALASREGPSTDLGEVHWADTSSASTHVSVEEMIDLEQQVDFFLVLGQDEAAIELLSTRLGADRPASALPYLKLLEIYQQRGEAEHFAEIAKTFADRFKALAPLWEANVAQGGGLEGHPAALARIQAIWHDSGASMASLQELLAHGGEDGRGFDLPAYRELLMLYAVARELSEREVRGEAVDLFLPLDASPAGSAGQSMMATMIWQPDPGAGVGSTMVDLDISLDDPEAGVPSADELKKA